MREDTPPRVNTRIPPTRKTIAKIMTTTMEPVIGIIRMSASPITTHLATGLRMPSLRHIAIHSGASDLVMDMALGSTAIRSIVITLHSTLRIIVPTDITVMGTDIPTRSFRSTADRGHSDRRGV